MRKIPPQRGGRRPSLWASTKRAKRGRTRRGAAPFPPLRPQEAVGRPTRSAGAHLPPPRGSLSPRAGRRLCAVDYQPHPAVRATCGCPLFSVEPSPPQWLVVGRRQQFGSVPPPPLRDRPPQAARERNLTIESANCRAEDDCRRQPPLRAVQLNAHPQVTSSLAATHWPTSLCLGCPGGGGAGTPPSFSRASKGGALGPLRPPNKTKPPLAVVWALERQRSVGGGWATRGRAHISTQRYQAWGRLT